MLASSENSIVAETPRSSRTQTLVFVVTEAYRCLSLDERQIRLIGRAAWSVKMLYIVVAAAKDPADPNGRLYQNGSLGRRIKQVVSSASFRSGLEQLVLAQLQLWP